MESSRLWKAAMPAGLVLLLFTPLHALAQSSQPLRIVITNDDGIAEVEARMMPVA